MSEATEAALISLTQSVTEGSTEVAQYIVETLATGHYFDGIAAMVFAAVVILSCLWGVIWSSRDLKKCIAKDEKYDGTCNFIFSMACVAISFCGLLIACTHLKHIFAPDAVAINAIISIIKYY